MLTIGPRSCVSISSCEAIATSGVSDDNPALQSLSGGGGTSISGTFLILIGRVTRMVKEPWHIPTVTALSVAVALIIGVIEIGGLLAEKTGIHSGPLAALANLELEYVGYGIVALFVDTWVAWVTIWKVDASTNAGVPTSTHRSEPTPPRGSGRPGGRVLTG